MAKLKGYILSSDRKDDENHLVNFYCVGENLNFKIEINDFFPLFFIERSSVIPFSKPSVTRKPINLKTLQEKEVDALYFKTQNDLNSAKEQFLFHGTRTYESDIRNAERFLMEHFLNGEIEVDGEEELEKGIITFKNPKIKPSEFKPQFKILSLDIETGKDGRLFSIAIVQRYKNEEKKRVFMLGEGLDRPDLNLSFIKTERELLEQFLETFRKWDPDIIIGWHVIGFDLKFLENKFDEFRISFCLGRDGSKPNIFEKRTTGWIAQITGRVVIDGPSALKSSYFKFENYKLETVSQIVLSTGKDITDNKVEEIERRFREDKESLAKYNLLDCLLVLNIFEKLSIIELIFQRARISGLQMDKIGISTLAFDHYYLPRIHREGYVSSNVLDLQREGESEDGVVFQPKPGIYDFVLVLDFQSLFPSIITTFNIDPLSRIMAKDNPLSNPTGIPFSKSKHILPKCLEDFRELRKEAIFRGNSILAQAIEMLINGLYSVLGSTSSRFYHADLPRAIAGTGKWIVDESIRFLESKGYSILYGDTDSIFLQLKETERKYFNEVGDELEKEINSFLSAKIYREFRANSKIAIKHTKAYKRLFLPFSREGLIDAKKRYVGMLLKEGKEELNIVGFEYGRSDWTELAKKFRAELFMKVFKDENIDDWIKDFIDRIKNKEFDGDLIYRKKLSKNPGEYNKNIPPHVKAALLLGHSPDRPLKEVSYVMTIRGPMPIQKAHSDLDYNHYIEKQIKPLADSILFLKGKNFEDLVMGNQLSLF